MSKTKFFYNNSGFNLIEILIVVAVFVIILTSALTLVNTTASREDLDAKSQEIVEFISQARNYSVTGYLGDVWGIKILNNNSYCDDSGDCLVLYKGKMFDYRDSSYDRVLQLNTGVYIGADEVNEFYFDFKSGWLSTSTASTLAEQTIKLNSNFGEEKTIQITPTGLAYTFTCGENYVYDTAGQAYRTVQIGNQCWMAENLNTGTMLAAASNDPTDNDVIEKWCYANTESNCVTRGGMYSWQEAMGWSSTEGVQGICPSGWHIPSNSEWNSLEDNYPGASAGTELKLNGSSGFEMLMGGEMDNTADAYDGLDTLAVFWTSTDGVASNAYIHYNDNGATMTETSNPYGWGFSLRCIKD
ncbi:prepilin-type N-terminal cleavage/methylation domain-containing protein [Candidatus Parcubacteria bacterium]|nr:MAG: prepilin-type N-terminal cleavage/methylation domain-containing protein [Candidatus Parcubacteria bacterium]